MAPNTAYVDCDWAWLTTVVMGCPITCRGGTGWKLICAWPTWTVVMGDACCKVGGTGWYDTSTVTDCDWYEHLLLSAGLGYPANCWPVHDRALAMHWPGC